MRFDKLRNGLLYAVSVMLLTCQAVFASELSAAKNERISISNQLEETILEKEAKEESVKEKESLICEIEDEIRLSQGSMDAIDEEISLLMALLSDAREEVRSARDDHDKKSEAARDIILRIYKNSRSAYSSAVSVSGNIFEMFGKLNYLSKIIDSEKQKITDSIESITSAEERESRIYQMVVSKNGEKRDAEDRLGSLLSSRSGAERELRQTLEDIESLDVKTNELKKYSDKVYEEIKKLQRGCSEYEGGLMLWPVPSSRKIVSYFGMRLHPVYKVRKMHYGIDIAASYGKYIVAASDGIVVSSCYITGYGYTVVIDHGGGVSTLYGHCSRLIAKSGDLVFRGDLIALIGSSGVSTGPHLHFEVMVDGVKKNPTKYLE